MAEYDEFRSQLDDLMHKRSESRQINIIGLRSPPDLVHLLPASMRL